jgi:hypothetical protein
MSKNSFYISFGIWIAVLPFLGVPNNWKTILTIASGLLVVVVNAAPIILKKVQSKPTRARKKSESKANIIAPKDEPKKEDSETSNGVVSEYMQEVPVVKKDEIKFEESKISE